MHPVVTDMRKAEAILAWAVEKMEDRYRLLAKAGVRHINSYNQLGEEEIIERLKPADALERDQIPNHLPSIVIIADGTVATTTTTERTWNTAERSSHGKTFKFFACYAGFAAAFRSSSAGTIRFQGDR